MPDLDVPIGKDRTVRNINIVGDPPRMESDVNIEQVGGQQQTPIDLGVEIAALASAVAGHDGSDYLLFEENAPLDVSAATVTVTDDGDFTIAGTVDASAAEIEVDLTTQSLGSLTVTDDGALAVDALDDSVGVEDTSGTPVDPAVATRYLDEGRTEYDLVGSGDLTIGPGSVKRGTAVVIAATSTDDNAFSVSASWEDAQGNVFQTEPAADIGLDTITEDYARLVRKAGRVRLTVTDESGAAQNTINIYVDTQR